MRAYVAVTDWEWFRYLEAHPGLTEANFWLPGGGPRNYGLKPGEPMLFKTHYPHNRLVGGGFLSDYRQLPVSIAWDVFGEANGRPSEQSLREAISGYRSSAAQADPTIGCVMLRDTVFLPPDRSLPAPDDFAKNIVTVKGYELTSDTKPEVLVALAALFSPARHSSADDDLRWTHAGPMSGTPASVAPRLGQSAFAAVVGEAYGMRCAITRNRVRPILQAAHIRPVASDGQHRVDNGLLLRADVHIMFDRGYLGVDPTKRTLLVSPELKKTFGNGTEFYALAGTEIGRPQRRADRPNGEFLQWHADVVFRS